MHGIPFIVSSVYLTLLVSFTMTLLETGLDEILLRKTLKRWGKFLLLLGVLGIVIQVLTWLK
jgi:hypothetical protein